MEEKKGPSQEANGEKQEKLVRFGQLFDEVFANHRCHFGQSLAHPLNLEVIEAEARKELEARQEGQSRLFASLSEVVDRINEDGGITAEVYKEHKAAINRFVREWLEISGIGYNPSSEDRLDQPATAEVLQGYPEDGFYETNYGNENIFGFDRDKEQIPGYDPDDKTLFVHRDEGIMWHREYKGEGGILSQFRIFNQGHRNGLHVKTVPIPELYARIREFVSTHEEESLVVPELGMSKGEYEQAMADFNREFAGLMEIRMGYGDWDSFGKKLTFHPLGEKYAGLDEVQPWLVVKDGHQEIAQAVVSTNPNLLVTDKGFSIIEYPQKGYERMIIYPLRGKRGEESLADIHCSQKNKYEWVKTGLLHYLSVKL